MIKLLTFKSFEEQNFWFCLTIAVFNVSYCRQLGPISIDPSDCQDISCVSADTRTVLCHLLILFWPHHMSPHVYLLFLTHFCTIVSITQVFMISCCLLIHHICTKYYVNFICLYLMRSWYWYLRSEPWSAINTSAVL